jgi:predicted PurR-regulated permease PerM
MNADPTIRAMLVLCTGILVLAALHLARSIFAPVAFSLFIIAIVWPLQRVLQARIPKLLALVVTLLATVAVIAGLAYSMMWGFSRIGQWVVNNAPRFQMLYLQANEWLEEHGISVVSQTIENFNVSWLVRGVQELGGRISGIVSFAIVTFVFTVLGLLEVDVTHRNIERLKSKEIAQSLLRAAADIAAKMQLYMLVRSVMSILTGSVVWGFALLAGLELATAWGVIAFALNYVPFLGPLVATVFPTLFALAQFESWRLAILVFLCLNLIQFLIGSYFEPRIAGATLSISPFLVLFAVFLWSFLWGIAGAFIGVPIVIAFLTICEHHQSTKWVATLLSGRDSAPGRFESR